MSPLLKEREVAHYLGDSGAGLVLAWHAFADEAHGGAGHALRDGWFHTGDPKGPTGKIVKREIVIPEDLGMR